MSEFTDHMEAKAEEIAASMERTSHYGWRAQIGDRSNIKPWYSARAALKPGVEVVVIGANPGGDASAPPNDAKVETYQRDLNREGFNAYLDESWDGASPGQSKLQRGVRTVFSTLYGGSANGDKSLRDSVCFNVCPLRTSDTSQIPDVVWLKSGVWCLEAVIHLNPNLIICNGIGDKSPWNALGSAVTQIDEEPLGRTSVRCGTIAREENEGIKVLGIPHLSRTGTWRATPIAIRNIASRCNIP